MKNAKNKNLSKRNTLLLCIGFCFFVNPVPLGLDLIPDVFGCVFLYFGLTQLAYFDGQIEQARKTVFYLFVVEFVKLLMMDMIYSTQISSNRMLGVTVFAILQGILYAMFFKQLMGGISYYSTRHDCNQTLKKCDGTAFLCYLAFFVRLLATVIPELMALVEVEINFEEDFEIIDLMTDFVSAKPIIVLLFSFIALVTSIPWIISIIGLFRLLHREGGEELNQVYLSNYLSRPEMIRPKKLRYASYLIYFALAFALDLVFDGIRIMPFSAMFLIIFSSVWILKDISPFKNTKKYFIPAFLLVLSTEIFRYILVPHGAITIYETDLWIVVVGAVLGILTAVVSLVAFRYFLLDTQELQKNLGGSDLEINGAWLSFCAFLILWSAGFIVPYFYSSVSALRLIASGVFIWQTSKIFVKINDEEIERFALYSK